VGSLGVPVGRPCRVYWKVSPYLWTSTLLSN